MLRHSSKIKKKGFLNGYVFTSIGTIIVTLLTVHYISIKSTTYIERPYDIPITDSAFYKISELTNWHKIDVGEFAIETPDDYLYTKLSAIDSKVGQISNGRDTIIFDYGWYSNDLKELQNDSTQTNWEQVAGRKFKIINSKKRRGFIGAYTSDLEDDNRFNIVCYNTDDQEKISKIYRTIKFRE